MRDSLRDLIRSVGLRVELFDSAQDFLRSERPDVPGCLVLDVRMPGQSGLDLQRRLNEAGVAIPIIFITGHGDVLMGVHAMKAGALEFLTKPFRDQDLLDAIQQALDRDCAAREGRAATEAIHRRFASLSSREREVMARVVGGLLNKQIAAELGTSENTVKLTVIRSWKRWEPILFPSWSGWLIGSEASSQSPNALDQRRIDAAIRPH